MRQPTEPAAGAADLQMVQISEKEFAAFRDLLHRVTGISLGAGKRQLLSSRLQARLRQLGLRRFGEYLDHVRKGPPEEMQRLVDLLTTNETYFFREPAHLKFLVEQILPTAAQGRPFRVWSAASSSGEEAYSIAMLLAEHLGGRPWEILGSDISTRVLERAREGRYPIEAVDKIPKNLLRKYCLRGVRSQEGQLLISPELRQRVEFRQINLNEPLPTVGEFDVIFLRNVMIYFEADMKRRVVSSLSRQLRPGGYLIIGLAETLKDICEDLCLKGPTAYQKPAR